MAMMAMTINAADITARAKDSELLIARLIKASVANFSGTEVPFYEAIQQSAARGAVMG